MNFGSDRTADFLQLVNTLRTTTLNGHVPVGNPPSLKSSHRQSSTNISTKVNTASNFAQMAALISSDLAVTCGRLESLSTLARQRTLFDDHSAEVQHLTLVIREDIANLNRRIADLSNLSKSNKPQNQSSKHATSVLMSLQSRLVVMSERFKRVLEQRSKTLKDQATRKSAFSVQDTKAITNGFTNPLVELETPTNTAPVIPSILLQDEQRARQASGVGDSSSVLLMDHNRQKQVTLYRDQTDAYLAARHDTVRAIEHTIIELGEIFQQLATMVHEQEERVERIDANIEESVVAVESGHAELLRYLRSVSSSRWLMLKIFGILLAFFIFFVIFFV